MKTIADYWRDAALEWDESSYEGRTRGSLVERFANTQRGHIRARYVTAESQLAGWIDGKSFVEIGIGGGELLVRLLELGARHGTGVDVSPQVCEVARRRAERAGVGDRAEVVTGTLDALDASLSTDLVTGLGILEYLQPAEVASLLRRLHPEQVFFSFDESNLTPKKAMHAVYRRLKKWPYYKKYSAAEIVALLDEAGYSDARVFRDGANSFVSTLPVQ